MSKEQIWLSDPSNKKVAQLRQLLAKAMEDQSRIIINYYDFLLVAKKLNFRFQESDHLMALRRHFFKNKNQILIRKLVGMLSISEQSLGEAIFYNGLPDKIIVKFNVEGEFETIKQLTNEDQQALESIEAASRIMYRKQKQTSRLNSKGQGEESGILPEHQSQQFKQKMTIILSIKVSEMIKKIRVLVQGTRLDEGSNILSIFDSLLLKQITFEIFKKGVVSLLRKIDSSNEQQRLSSAMSEDDIKAIFFILDKNKQGFISKSDLFQLRNQQKITEKITKFYQERINKKMVQNTMFKLGKINSSIQIFQLKNASVLEFKSMEEAVLNQSNSHQSYMQQKLLKLRIPHFGPIKGNNLRNSPSKISTSNEKKTQRQGNRTALSAYKLEQMGDQTMSKEREKIERIIRTSKQDKKKKGRDTIANKLRKLFIHKVILPRQRMLEDEKSKYSHPRSQSNNLTFRPL